MYRCSVEHGTKFYSNDKWMQAGEQHWECWPLNGIILTNSSRHIEFFCVFKLDLYNEITQRKKNALNERKKKKRFLILLKSETGTNRR